MKLLAKLFLVIVCLLAIILLTVSCGKWIPVTVENNSDQFVDVYAGFVGIKAPLTKPERYWHIGTVAANTSITMRDTDIETHYHFPYLLEAKTETGTVLFSKWFTYLELVELQDIGLKIVIQPP
ncbi:hypothetical protein ACFLTR_04405 [Chloroflexota bacterium]